MAEEIRRHPSLYDILNHHQSVFDSTFSEKMNRFCYTLAVLCDMKGKVTMSEA